MTLLLSLACVDGHTYLDEPLWSSEIVSTNDGVFVPIARGQIAEVTPKGWTTLDLQGGYATRMIASPDGESLLVFAYWEECSVEGRRIRSESDCYQEQGELVTTHELVIYQEGERAGAVEIPSHFNALDFTSDGRTAVAYLDYQPGMTLPAGSLGDITQLLFIDLTDVSTTPVPIGYPADRLLFNADDTRAVILSQSEIVIIELETGDYERVVTFPLSLDVDATVSPEDVSLTPDGNYAIITVEGGRDLYVLDLVAESINIVSLDSVPSDMIVDPTVDRTVLAYGGRNTVDLMDHVYFEVESIALEETANRIVALDGQVLLFSDVGNKDVYRLDLETTELVEYRMKNPPNSLQVEPGELYAVAITRPEGGFADDVESLFDVNYGVEILDLGSDKSIPLIATAMPLGIEFSGSGADSQALVLLQGVEELTLVNLPTGASAQLELEAPPVSIGTWGDAYVILHDAPLGMVSFLDPRTGEVTDTVGGFGSAGLFPPDERPLALRGEQ